MPVGGERSPAKRAKRMSLLAVSSMRLNASSRLKLPDANTSAEMSFSKAGGKPSWR